MKGRKQKKRFEEIDRKAERRTEKGDWQIAEIGR